MAAIALVVLGCGLTGVAMAQPTVTLNPVPPSNDTTPTFSGTTSESGEVVVHIYNALAQEVSSAKASSGGSGWTSDSAFPALETKIGEIGYYTAVASEEGSSGTGESNPVPFVVDAAPPEVTLNKPTSPSGNTTPSFTGSTTEAGVVVVHVYNHLGLEVAGPTASTGGGGWTSGSVSPPLEGGEYTARAEQTSSLGNGIGKSKVVSFVVDTASPEVGLNKPTSPSKDTTPSFTGTATESTEPVVVRVYNLAHEEKGSATASGTGGPWTSGVLDSTLGSGEYTAQAEQASSLGNAPGKSNIVSFVVDTASPEVGLNKPTSPSKDTTPSFTGTATESTEPVVVRVYNLAHEEKGSATASGTGGPWTSGALDSTLGSGEYTAQAEQASSLGNPPGKSAVVSFVVNTASPEVVLNQPTSPSKDTTPSFTGTASESTEPVVVHVFNSAHEEKGSATASGTGGAWTSGALSATLLSGEYTAEAEQASSVGNPVGKSIVVKFVVNTASPTVVLNQPTSPSSDATPSFTGTATESTEPIVVHVYNSAHEEKGTATASGTGGAWTSGALSATLLSGEYTAEAEQASSLGNPVGKSIVVKFVVNTAAPTVTLVAPEKRTRDTTPSFEGTASETEPVIVKIYEGAKVAGAIVAEATATPAGGKWKGELTKALPSGEHTYTAIASEKSSLGNGEGVSAEVSFAVDTEAPKLTLSPPVEHSNGRTPIFSGETNEEEKVTVEIYEGLKAEGRVVAEATATPKEGKWESAKATPALAEGTHDYTAVAYQKSSIKEGPEAKTKPASFEVDTKAPTVTLSAPPVWTNNTTPSFSGSAGDRTTVTVEIHAGATDLGALVATTTATGTGGSWSSAPVAHPLADGQYTAVAQQKSSVGEYLGESRSFTFNVDTVPPHVTLTYPSSGSSTTGESQLVEGSAGTAAGDLPAVTVQLFSGSAPGGQVIQSVVVDAQAGSWSTTFGALSPGTYTVSAEQSDQAGNLGVGVPSTFVVARAASNVAPAVQAVPSVAPTASFSWFPAAPYTGESVSLVSSSTDPSSPITGFAWSLAGGPFQSGSAVMNTSFATAGTHVVALRATAANGLSSVATEAIAVASARARLMKPFPVVRITVTHVYQGVKLRLLSVQAGAGARVTVTCRGHGCPLKSQTRIAAAGKVGAGPIEFRRFERLLPDGVILEIRVSKAGEIGKYTRFAIRSGKLPLRIDTCLAPAGVKSMACPSP
ncbi:MAG: Ig-like domain-containing protein [Solirubrobacteraceae bacterium]